MDLLAFIPGIPGGMEWIVILAVVLLIFGPTQIPKLAKMLGKSAKSLKDGLDGKLADEDEKSAPKTSDKPEEDAPEAKDSDES